MGTSKRMRVAVLISGRGSNLEALLTKAASYEVVLVGSNRTDAPGLQFAHERSLPVVVVDRAEYPTKSQAQARLASEITRAQVELVVLAGFMQILTPEFVNTFKHRIVNVHPSLLPNFPGLDTHARAIAAGEEMHGCTVHMVDTGVDTGPIIAQSRLPILPDETPESLDARVRRIEHHLYPWVVEQIANRGILLTENGPVIDPETRVDGALQGFHLR